MGTDWDTYRRPLTCFTRIRKKERERNSQWVWVSEKKTPSFARWHLCLCVLSNSHSVNYTQPVMAVSLIVATAMTGITGQDTKGDNGHCHPYSDSHFRTQRHTHTYTHIHSHHVRRDLSGCANGCGCFIDCGNWVMPIKNATGLPILLSIIASHSLSLSLSLPYPHHSITVIVIVIRLLTTWYLVQFFLL